MKKISFLMLFALSFLVLSCRTEDFHNEEVNQTISQPRLTSKRISLNEAKHKTKLLPELKKAEVEIEAFAKKNAKGKISYDDGVSIDTDNVIYIENGPDFYTYTFRIQRDQAAPDAPVENLVLSPLSDGSWKEELITYNLTPQEKQTMLAGGVVNLTGKVSHTLLQSGTYSQGIMQKGVFCYDYVDAYYTTCSGGLHHNGEEYGPLSEGKCPEKTQSVLMVTVSRKCEITGSGESGSNSGSPTIGYNPVGNTGGSGTTNPNDPTGNNGATNPENPCGGSSVPSQPVDPSSTIGTQECNPATPTLPILSVEHFKFNQVISQLSPELQSWINQTYNAEFYTGLINYFTTNNQSLEAGNFVKWSIAFLHQNQNVTWAEFQNWAINNYDNAYRDKLALLTPSEMQNFIDINREIDASLYEEEFVKETNEAFVAFASFADIETMTNVEMQSVLNSCCPSIIVVPQALTLEKSRLIAANYQFNRKYYPEWSKAKCFWEASRETIQLLLDLGGLVPVIGEVCDLTNATIYALNGDGVNASLSAAGAIPFAGWFTTGSKLGVKVVNKVASDIGSRQVLKWVVGNDGLIKFGYSSQLRKVLKLTDATKQAHHIIPWALHNNAIVQKAAKSANAFHLNEALNGIAVASWRNQPNHHAYNTRILNKLNDLPSNLTSDQAYNNLLIILNQAKQAVINNPNTHLNDLIF